MTAFDLLHPTLREAIWHQGWKELRPLQVESIQAVMESDDHLILSAATASGKTEAAFLPVLSQVIQGAGPGISALYISPLKALINDQFRRLETLCEGAQIPVHRWHGDVSATDKRKLREQPEGVLLITPESLESQCINYGNQLSRLYSGLQFIVIDELHSFLEGVRGIHLRSLLSRIIFASGCQPRLLGLSATLGDFGPAQFFLCPKKPARVRVLKEEGAERELRIGLKCFLRPARKPLEPAEELAAEQALVRDVCTRFRKATNLIFFNSRGLAEEIADLVAQQVRRENWPQNPFRVHHGSLSKELREAAEEELKSTQAITALCTRTLEMGIDIGAVQSVGQVGAPWQVASLVQRVGRSGRREGEAQVLRLYILENELTDTSTREERLFPQLVQGVAMVRLLLQKWVETPRATRKHFSTLVHQVLSVLRQTGGLQASALFGLLCERGAFIHITKADFAAVLRSMAGNQLIEQMPQGEVILAPDGEMIVESRDFYAAFASSVEFSIEHDVDKIGTLAGDQVPPVGEHLLLGGRRWRCVDIDDRARRVLVTPARGKKTPLFAGSKGMLDQKVMQSMLSVLEDDDTPAYLHADAAVLLQGARRFFSEIQAVNGDLIEGIGGVEVMPWEGSAIHETLVACARADGLKATLSPLGLAVVYAGCSKAQVISHWRGIAGGRLKPEDLIPFVGKVAQDKFDEFLPEGLLATSYIHEVLDLSGAMKAAERLSTSI